MQFNSYRCHSITWGITRRPSPGEARLVSWMACAAATVEERGASSWCCSASHTMKCPRL
jgi:hypothetical protein